MNSTVSNILNNDYVLASLAIFITSYIALSRVYLPEFIVELFKSGVFRVLFLSLLLIFHFGKAPHVSLIVALVFVVTLDYIARRESHENFLVVSEHIKHNKK
jgi:hypothetical protein